MASLPVEFNFSLPPEQDQYSNDTEEKNEFY